MKEAESALSTVGNVSQAMKFLGSLFPGITETP